MALAGRGGYPGDSRREVGTTTVYVTHDQVEAMTMGDRMAILRDGVLEQVGAPDDVYAGPANTFVAGFIGTPAMGLVRAGVERNGGASRLVLGDLRLDLGEVRDLRRYNRSRPHGALGQRAPASRLNNLVGKYT